MKYCEQGHENRDDAVRCVVCYQRLSEPQPAAVLELTLPQRAVVVRAGATATFTLKIRLTGAERATVRVSATGSASAWIPEDLVDRSLDIGAAAEVPYRLDVPAEAAGGRCVMDLVARPLSPEGPTAQARLVVDVEAVPRAGDTTTRLPPLWATGPGAVPEPGEPENEAEPPPPTPPGPNPWFRRAMILVLAVILVAGAGLAWRFLPWPGETCQPLVANPLGADGVRHSDETNDNRVLSAEKMRYGSPDDFETERWVLDLDPEDDSDEPYWYVASVGSGDRLEVGVQGMPSENFAPTLLPQVRHEKHLKAEYRCSYEDSSKGDMMLLVLDIDAAAWNACWLAGPPRLYVDVSDTPRGC